MTDSTNLITLTSFCLEHAADKELAILMNSIQLSCKFISRAVRKAGIANLCANPHRVLSTERQGPFALGIFFAARHDRHPR
jgi:fructose-1,6-bisphosphatase